MKAVQFHEYGSPEVLQYETVEQPDVKRDHLLIDVHAAAVNPVDWRYRKGQLKWYDWFGSFPRVPGCDLAGKVRDAGSDAGNFSPGDDVFAMTGPLEIGTYAEVVSVPHDYVAGIPEDLTMNEAASLPLVSLTSLQALRDKANLSRNEHVLINGASGGVGTVGVQIAKARGATVTGVCSHRNLDLVESLGADRVIDYTEKDFAEDHNQYDVIYDAFGNRSLDKVRNALRPEGHYVTTDIRLGRWLDVPLSRLGSGPSADVVVVQPDGEDLEDIKTLVETNQLEATIDRTYPLSEADEAHRYSETRRARGKIVLQVNEP